MTAETSTILVPLSGSAHATVALPVARGLAALAGATLDILHLGAGVVPARDLLTDLGLAADHLRGAVLDQVEDEPTSRIVVRARAQKSLLIVMGTPTLEEAPEGALGYVAEQVLRGAPCPVVLVPAARGHRPWALRRLLLPHDGTPTSAAAIGPAADLACRADAEVVVLHVAAPGVSPPMEPGTFAASRYADQPQHEWPAWASEFLERACALGHSPGAARIRLMLAHGVTGPAVVKVVAREPSDLVALAWRGGLEPARALTLRAVIREAPCPVIVFRVAEG